MIVNSRREPLSASFSKKQTEGVLKHYIKRFSLRRTEFVIYPLYSGINIYVDYNKKELFFSSSKKNYYDLFLREREDIILKAKEVGGVVSGLLTLTEEDKKSMENMKEFRLFSLSISALGESKIIKKLHFLPFELYKEFERKEEELNILERKYLKIKQKDLSIEYLKELSKYFRSKEDRYYLYGLVIEINDKKKRDVVIDAKFYSNKGFLFTETTKKELEVEIKSIEWTLLSTGVMKPKGIIKEVRSDDGVTLRRVDLINARMVKENNIGIGSKIKVSVFGGRILQFRKMLEEGNDYVFPIKYKTNFTLFDGRDLKVEGECEDIQKMKVDEFLRRNNILMPKPSFNNLFKMGYDRVYKIPRFEEDRLSTETDLSPLFLRELGKCKKKFLSEGITMVDLMKSSGVFSNSLFQQLPLLIKEYGITKQNILTRTIYNKDKNKIFIQGLERFQPFYKEQIRGLIKIK